MYDPAVLDQPNELEVATIAIKSYVETSLRIAQHQLERATDPKQQEKLSAIVIGLKIAMDNIVNEY